MQQKQEYEAQMALSIGGNSSACAVLQAKESPAGNRLSIESDGNSSTSSIKSGSNKLKDFEKPNILPRPISQLRSQRSSQDSDRSDTSHQSSESDRVILESNDDEEDEDDDEACNKDDTTNANVKEMSKQDSSKNNEIRRLSSTDDGDKVLHSAWESPEKESVGKSPLEMVQNIVSSIDAPKSAESKDQDDTIEEDAAANHTKESCSAKNSFPPPLEKTDIPAWVQSSGKPLMHSQQLVANQTPPSNFTNVLSQPPPQPPTSVPQTFAVQTQSNSMNPGQIQTNTLAPSLPMVSQSGTQLIFTPATSQPQTMTGQQISAGVGQPNHQPPIMQIVNTVNGPMLMQAFPTPAGMGNMGTIQAATPNLGTFPAGGNMVIPTTNGSIQSQQNMSVQGSSLTHQQESSSSSVETEGFEDDNDNNAEEGVEPRPQKKKRPGKKKKGELSSPTNNPSESPNQPTQFQPHGGMPQQGQMPLLVSPSIGSIPCNPNANNIPTTLNNQAQVLTLGNPNQTTPSMGATPSPQAMQPLIMNQAGTVLTNVGGQVLLSNGSFMAVPAVYNQQMPDGSIVQVQNGISQMPPPAMIQQGPPSMIAGNGAGPILMGPQPGGAFVPNGGTYIMTPQGLVPAAPAGTLQNAPSQPGQHQPTFQQGNFMTIGPNGATNQPLQQITISPAHTPTLVQQATPPPTQLNQQQQILTVQHQQGAAPPMPMSIAIEDDHSGDDSVSMSPPSARSTPIPKSTKTKKSKKKRPTKDFRRPNKSHHTAKVKFQAVPGEEESEEEDCDDSKEEDNEEQRVDEQDDSDIEEIIQGAALDDDDVSDEDEESPFARSSAESSRSALSGDGNIPSSSRFKTKHMHHKRSKSAKGSKIFIQSNKVDSSGRKATPPHSADDKLSGSELISSSHVDASLDISGTSNSSGGSLANNDSNEPSSSRNTSKSRHRKTTSSSQKKRKRNADVLLQEDTPQEDSDGM